jgi:hypothetical protein
MVVMDGGQRIYGRVHRSQVLFIRSINRLGWVGLAGDVSSLASPCVLLTASKRVAEGDAPDDIYTRQSLQFALQFALHFFFRLAVYT